MPRRRIAIVTDWYPSVDRPYRGRFVAEQARAVARRHEVAVVVSPSAGPPTGGAVAVEEGIRTLRPGHASPPVPGLGFALRVAATARALRGLRPEVLHAHVFGPGLVALAAGRLLGVPVVVSEHFSGVARGALGPWERRLAAAVYRRADVVCPVSGNLAEAVRALGAARVRVVPNPVDTARFHPGGPAASGPLRLLFVGSLVDAKGVPELIDALARVRARENEGVVLELVGDGPQRQAYERRARALGLRDAVAFRGALGHAAVGDAMRRADVLVLPSHWENAPCAVSEALASGLRVVATRVGGLPELVGPGEGALVAPGDAGALADALATATRPSRAERDRRAREAADRFGFDAVGEAWSQVYEDALARRRR